MGAQLVLPRAVVRDVRVSSRVNVVVDAQLRVPREEDGATEDALSRPSHLGTRGRRSPLAEVPQTPGFEGGAVLPGPRPASLSLRPRPEVLLQGSQEVIRGNVDLRGPLPLHVAGRRASAASWEEPLVVPQTEEERVGEVA